MVDSARSAEVAEPVGTGRVGMEPRTSAAERSSGRGPSDPGEPVARTSGHASPLAWPVRAAWYTLLARWPELVRPDRYRAAVPAGAVSEPLARSEVVPPQP